MNDLRVVNDNYERLCRMARVYSKGEAIKFLRRFGITQERIDAMLAELTDPIDLDRDRPVMERYGLTDSTLREMMGSSP